MKKPVLVILGFVLASLATAQNAQLVINNTGGAANHPWIVFNPVIDPSLNSGTYLVIGNPAGNGVVELAGSQPVIKSELERNKIRWINGSGAAGQVYKIPYSTAVGTAMPLSVTKSTAGTASVNSSMVFSTYNSAGFFPAVAAPDVWWNDMYKPTGVTHMNEYANGSLDNSENAIDRFWIIDPSEGAYAYTAKPDVSMTMGYVNTDISALNLSNGGISTTTPLQAQRFNTAISKWGDYQSSTTATPSTFNLNVSVSGVLVTGANFFRAWTLSSSADPLPIELTEWKGACDGKEVKLTWTTASEHDNDFYTIEKSKDGENWNVLATVDAVGNSVSSTTYNYVDESTDGLAYYRLAQTDVDGRPYQFDMVAAGCETDNTEIVNAWDDGDDLNLTVSSTSTAIYDLSVLDVQGKVMAYRPAQTINKGYTSFTLNKAGIAPGIYMVQLQNTSDMMMRRVMLY